MIHQCDPALEGLVALLPLDLVGRSRGVKRLGDSLFYDILLSPFLLTESF